MWLDGKSVLLGVTGSIAAYKSAELCSSLGKLGADVHVVLTSAATHFIGEATLRSLTRNPVMVDLFDEPAARRIAHIDLAQSADLVIVAPATADIIAKYAHGIADDMLTTCLLATPASTPVLFAPAMNTLMWEHPATRANMAMLEARGVHMTPPVHGMLACQDVGIGKLADNEAILKAIEELTVGKRDYVDTRVLITAGATREPIDPVRFITNRSSGRMGFALARDAAARGAQVTVVAGHTSISAPGGVTLVTVQTADEMCAACIELFPDADLFIGAAAVADYTPAAYSPHKIKKSRNNANLIVEMQRTPDIAAELGKRKRPGQVTVGFAAETENVIENAAHKLSSKQLDLIAANDVTMDGAGFDVDTNIVTLVWPDGRTASLPKLSKQDTASRILDSILPLLAKAPSI